MAFPLAAKLSSGDSWFQTTDKTPARIEAPGHVILHPGKDQVQCLSMLLTLAARSLMLYSQRSV